MIRTSSCLLALLALLSATPAFAHQVVEQPSLGRLIAAAEIVVRGTISEPSRRERGALVAELRIEKVLKGDLAGGEIVFASDPDHGIDYASGERVLLFLSPAPRAAPARYVSPQVFGMRYPITSFDPTGYDGLVLGLGAARRESTGAARLRKTEEVLRAQLASHERRVRLYATEALEQLDTRRAAASERPAISSEAVKKYPEWDFFTASGDQ